MRRCAAPALALLLLLPLGALAAPPAADPFGVEVDHVGAADALLTGSLAGTVWDVLEPPGELPGGWTVQADRAALRFERARHDAVVYSLSVTPNNNSRWTESYTGFSATFTAAQGRARILVLPADDGRAVASLDDELQASAGPLTLLVHERVASSSAPDFEIDARQAFEARPGSGLVTVTGDLQVVVAGLLADVASDQGAGHLDTRRSEGSLEPTGTVGWTESVEAVLDLHGARLTLPASAVYLTSGDLEARGDLRLDRVNGTLDLGGHPVRLDSQRLDLVGRPTAALETSGGRLRAVLGGDLTAASIDGRPVPWPVRQSAGSPWALAIAAATVALALAAAHAIVGRQRFRRLDASLDARRYDDALRLAERFRLHPWFRQDAALAAALSLGELGRPAESRDRLLAEARWAPARRGMRDFLLARAAARLGELSEATRLLAASLLADPALTAQAAADPAFAALLDRGRRGPLEAYA